MQPVFTEDPKLDAAAKSAAMARARGSIQNLKALTKGQYSMFGSIELTALMETHDEIVAEIRKIESLEDRIQLAHKDLGAKVEKLATMIALLKDSDPKNPPELLKPKATSEIQKIFRQKWQKATKETIKSIPFYLDAALKRYGFKITSAKVDEKYEHLTIELRRRRSQPIPKVEDLNALYNVTVQAATAFGRREDTISSLELFHELAKEPTPKVSADLLLNAIKSVTTAGDGKAQDTS